jgi:hypothetical protein
MAALIEGMPRLLLASLIAALILALGGCSGESSERELKNRRELEAILTAVSLKNRKELERDARRIEDRHTSGELSDAPYRTLQEIVEKARAGDWAAADSGPTSSARPRRSSGRQRPVRSPPHRRSPGRSP